MPSSSGLAEFVLKTFQDWQTQRKNTLDIKFNANLNAMKRQDPDFKKPFKKDEGKDWRSTTYIGATRVKVFSAFAMLSDLVLQGGRIPFTLKGSDHERELMDEEAQLDQDENIEIMENKIREQDTDRKADRQMMLKILSLCTYGMAWSKYTVKQIEKFVFQSVDQGLDEGLDEFAEDEFVRFEEIRETEMVPGHDYRSIWNMYWDMEDDDLQTNGGVAEYNLASPTSIRAKKGGRFYIDRFIDKVLSEFEAKSEVKDKDSLEPGKREVVNRRNTIPNIEFWGWAPKKMVVQFEKDLKQKKGVDDFRMSQIDDTEDAGDDVEVMVEMAGGEIIRFARNKTGTRPYKKCVWEIALDETTGDGIPDNMAAVEFMLNGFWRAFEDNKKLTGNLILAMKSRYFKDPAQTETLGPGDKLEISDDIDDVRKALMPIIFPDVGESLLSGVGLAEAWGDTLSQVPRIMQGATIPKQKPDTAYELSQLLDNATKYFGMGIRNMDESFIEPETNDKYRYNMRNPEMKKGKGDYKVHAEGFTGFKNKVVLVQKLQEMMSLVLSSETLTGRVKVDKYLNDIHKGLDLDPDEYLKSEEEMAEEQQAQQEAQQQALQDEIQVEVMKEQAKSRAKAESDIAVAQAKGEIDLAKEGVKGDAKREEDEDGFQRDIIMEGLKAQQEPKKPAK